MLLMAEADGLMMAEADGLMMADVGLLPYTCGHVGPD
jgi:hypothetical protein